MGAAMFDLESYLLFISPFIAIVACLLIGYFIVFIYKLREVNSFFNFFISVFIVLSLLKYAPVLENCDFYIARPTKVECVIDSDEKDDEYNKSKLRKCSSFGYFKTRTTRR